MSALHKFMDAVFGTRRQRLAFHAINLVGDLALLALLPIVDVGRHQRLVFLIVALLVAGNAFGLLLNREGPRASRGAGEENTG